MAYTLWLSFVFLVIYKKLKPNVVDFFNTPKRIAKLEQVMELRNGLINPRLEAILKQIAEDYKTLNYENMPAIITEIFKRLTILEEKTKINQFPCDDCKEPFEGLALDHIFTIAMKDKCSVCDMLNLLMFRRESYRCKKCGHINYIFWHHKDEHTFDENRMAERMFYGKSD